MARTGTNLGTPDVVRRYSDACAAEINVKSFWNSRLTSSTGDMPVWRKADLEKNKGKSIEFNLACHIGGETIHGDDMGEGSEEPLRYFNALIYIDAEAKGVDMGGKMYRQSILDDTRARAKMALTNYVARWYDYHLFYHASGARGINNTGYSSTHKLTFTGGPNLLRTPNSAHLRYAGAATAKNNLASTDLINLTLVSSLRAYARSMGDGALNMPAIQPVMIDGEETFIFVMHPYQAKAMKTSSSSEDWLAVNKAAMGAEGTRNNAFKGSMGVYDKVILQDHERVVTFNDYGAAGNVNAARALFLGQQAICVAHGSAGGARDGVPFQWGEEEYDWGRKTRGFVDWIIGVSKTGYTDPVTNTTYDFGVIAADAALPSS